jgi:hypothetical protein
MVPGHGPGTREKCSALSATKSMHAKGRWIDRPAHATIGAAGAVGSRLRAEATLGWRRGSASCLCGGFALVAACGTSGRALARSAQARARGLVSRAPGLRDRLGGTCLGRCGRLGHSSVPRVLPLRGAADGAAPRARLAAPLRVEASRRAGTRLHRLGGRRRDLGARPRRLRRRHTRGAGPPRFLPRPVPRCRCKRHRNAGRSRCGTRHNEAQAARQCAHRRRDRRCRRWHRSIRLGCCENGGFCGNCSTSSLRRFYSFAPQGSLTNR